MDSLSIQRTAVVGAGTMGNGIAHVLALAGYDVALVDLNGDVLDAATSTIASNLDRQVDKDRIDANDRDRALDRLRPTPDTADGVADADLVVEAVSETQDVKQTVFADLDRHAPDHAILASNTSSISITWLAAQTERPEQVIGMHFFNPVPVMRLVEIVRGQRTTDATFEAVDELARDLGKEPVEVEDYPGFVSNRILMPMINEAVFCVMEGVAEPEDIDTVMKLGMNHPMGPLTLADFIGLDVCLDILEVLHGDLGDDKYRPCPLLRRMVTAGQLGRKTGEGFFPYNE
jgi:3-hydroxybutyryl-CoA dehydrogenase